MKHLFVFCLFAVLLACSGNVREEGEQLSEEGTITLVFEDPHTTDPDRTGEVFAIRRSLSYVLDNFINVNVDVYPEPYDTIVIKTRRRMVEVRHEYKGIDDLSFLLRAGDTVKFTYQEGKPIASRLAASGFDTELNYDIIKRSYVCNDSFPSHTILRSFHQFLTLPFKNVESESADLFSALKANSSIEFLREDHLLDSLYEHKLISTDHYRFYATKSEIEKEKCNLDDPNFYLIKQEFNSATASRSLLGALRNFDDSLLLFGFYRNNLEWYYQIEGRKVQRRISSSGNTPDYKSLYDTVKASTLYPSILKKLLLLQCMEDIVRSSSWSDIKKYRGQFRTDIQDSSYVNYFFNKYKVEEEVASAMILLSSTNERIDLEDLLSQHRGKPVYVDIWASWCGPCIAAMPSAHKLQEEFKDDVVFMYLSKDEDYDRWLRAARRLKLQPSFSFLAENPYTSKFFEDIRVEGIPRYLLYDQSGKLVHQFAPAPGSNEVRELFRAYLSEQSQ